RARQQVTGRVLSSEKEVTTPGGFYVELQSFENELKNYSDMPRMFTNPDGTFAADVLPGETYCCFVSDKRWVGKMIDLIPCDADRTKLTPPELEVFAGEPVEVAVTSGPKNGPVANLPVLFRRYHQFQYMKNGIRHGAMGGPQCYVTTDEQGIARTR